MMYFPSGTRREAYRAGQPRFQVEREITEKRHTAFVGVRSIARFLLHAVFVLAVAIGFVGCSSVPPARAVSPDKAVSRAVPSQTPLEESSASEDSQSNVSNVKPSADEDVEGEEILAELAAEHSRKTEEFLREVNRSSFPRLNSDHLNRGMFLIYVVGGCHLVKKHSELVDRVAGEKGVYDLFAYAYEQEVKQHFPDFDPPGVPLVVLVEDGAVSDALLGGRSNSTLDKRSLLQFLGANDVIEGGPEFVVEWNAEEASRAKTTRVHDGDKLTGLDLRGSYFQNGSFNRADLRGADLRNADLRNVQMSRADLTGAKMRGANVEGVWWNDTICPTGVNSDDVGGTCVGELLRDSRPKKR